MLLQVVVALCAVAPLCAATATCSYDDSSLLDWDSAATWGGEEYMPKAKETATIPKGKHVRLNVSPPDLKGIVIESEASLVWGNVGGLTVTTDYIHVKGSFIVGDEDCPFTQKAHIRLTGKSNTGKKLPGIGKKVIGVDAGGTIELHGAVKKSWSYLIQTAKPPSETCGVIFDLRESKFQWESGKGLFGIIFNLDGSVYDFGVFKTADEKVKTAEEMFQGFIDGIPDDKILVVAVNGDFGKGTVSRDWDMIYEAVESVGGLTSSLLRQVKGREAYAFITRTGNASSTQEEHVRFKKNEEFVSTSELSILDDTHSLKFSVVGIVSADVNKNKELEVRVLSDDVVRPRIKLNADVTSWKPDDRIVVASTDFDWRQAEEFKLVKCDDCQANEVRLDHSFEHVHYGEITLDVDERAEVGLLTRNILIEGILEDECYENDKEDKFLCDIFKRDMYGGHVKVVRGFAAAHIEGVELYHMGQQKFIGSYALHFHMCDDVEGNWFRNNSIHHALTRCVTVHGTDHAEVSDNVCYLTHGHSYFLEDSAEQWNIFDGNLGLGTQHGAHTLADMRKEWCNATMKGYCDGLSTFWLTHPNNYVRNNVAAGSDKVGFWYINSFLPIGPSRARQEERKLVGFKHAYHSKILEFDNNVVHSCNGRGLRLDDRLSEGIYVGKVYVPPNGVMQDETTHVPRDPPQADGKLVTSRMTRFRAYKNKIQNVWTKGGNLVLNRFTIADSNRGLSMARGIEHTYTEIKNSIFVGETNNVGRRQSPFNRSRTGMPDDVLQGVIFYQGPGIVTNCFFNNYTFKYTDTLFRAAGAISLRRNSTYHASPTSGVSGITFGFCDKVGGNWVFNGNLSVPGFADQDGNKQANFHDYDGSVTGTAGTQVVKNERFFTTGRCRYEETWNMAVCPYEYARVILDGKGGVLETRPKDYAMTIRRDDRPADAFQIRGLRKISYLVLKSMSYTAYFNGKAPTELEVIGENLKKGDSFRIGLCFPKDVESFTFESQFPVIDEDSPATQLASIDELDKDSSGTAYFWDKARGLLFVKLVGTADRIDHEICPGRQCPYITIKRVGGSDKTVDCYKDAYVDGPYTRKEDKSAPIPKPATCKIGTPKGLGAPIAPNNYPTGPFQPSCPAAPKYPKPVLKGCYKDVSDHHDLPYERIDLFSSMTIEHCSERCYRKQYAYAGLQNGNRCYCGHTYGAYLETPDDCNKPCTGNKDTSCGDMDRNSVYHTGIEPKSSSLQACGPENAGVVINSQCYYLTPEEGAYADAQKTCVNLVGNLATISSEQIQDDVVEYMRPKGVDAWFGLNDIAEEGTLAFVDGTPVGNYDNTQSGQGVSANQDGYVIRASVLYKWDDRSVSEKNKALCQFAVGSQPPTGESCGVNGFGNRFGSGSCYAVINSLGSQFESQYACYTRMGTLVTVTDDNRAEILQHIYVYGDSVDYWTGEEGLRNPTNYLRKCSTAKLLHRLARKTALCAYWKPSQQTRDVQQGGST
ncbi:cell surface hyaluronidase-like [Haliotis rubra]|uniref:cell surface hyaluronidase-like n=1 Tax=Haliotis rubra TaxID=36100 RepID=UPI001EE5D2D0|nr:cell surface hyaluronidase-like [Haliotis rubra]